MQRDGYSREDAYARVKSQMSISEKVSHADIVVDNSDIEMNWRPMSSLLYMSWMQLWGGLGGSVGSCLLLVCFRRRGYYYGENTLRNGGKAQYRLLSASADEKAVLIVVVNLEKWF